ncbi:MAG: hypothetical protein H0W64_07170 [Gammaproteobacteria bacterium]|nr:hypothetical protein [Gammaproteobacteria bacterium]
MTIKDGHKNHINTMIGYLLDFSEDPRELSKEIDELILALSQPVNVENSFYHFRKYLLQPQETLLGLENMNDKDHQITIGEARRCLLELCQNALSGLITPNSLHFQSLKQAFEKMVLELSHQHDNQNVFKSLYPAADGGMVIGSHIEKPGQIYNASISFSGDQAYLNFHITKYFNTNTYHKSFQAAPIHDPTFNVATFILHISAKANKYAAKVVKEYVLDFFLGNKYISLVEFVSLLSNKNNSFVLTHEFYLDLFLNNKIDIDFFNNVSDAIIDPNVIDLIKNKLCTYDHLLLIQPHHVPLIIAYNKLLLTHTITIDQIIDIDKDQSKIFKMPVIINKIMKHDYNFNDVKKIPSYLKPILSKQFNNEYLATHDVPIYALTRIDEAKAKLLQTKEMQDLMDKNIINFLDIHQFEPETRAAITRPKILKLLTDRLLTLDQLNSLPLSGIKLVDEHPYITDWLKQGIINDTSLYAKKLKHFYAEVYANRLLALINNKPFTCSNHIDSMISLKKEMRLTAYHAEVTKEKLIEAINDVLLEKLKHQFKKNLNQTLPYYTAQCLRELKHILTHSHGFSAKDKLIQCSLKASEFLNETQDTPVIKKQKSMPSDGFFKGKQSSEINLDQLCKGLSELHAILDPHAEIAVKPNQSFFSFLS